MALNRVLNELDLASLLSTFEAEDMDLDTLQWMAKDEETDFVESMAELSIGVSVAKRLQHCLLALDDDGATACDDATPAANDSEPEPAPSSEAADTLTALLRRHGLQMHAEKLAEEDLTLETLCWMADDSEYVASMLELGLSAEDAARLREALKADERRNASAAHPSTRPIGASAVPPPAPRAPAGSEAAPPAAVANKDAPSLVGRRVLIQGLASRKDLNGRCGMVLFHDAVSGRCACASVERAPPIDWRPPQPFDSSARCQPPLSDRHMA